MQSKLKRQWMHLATVLCLLAASRIAFASALEDLFVQPPASAKPHVYWYWMCGNISREGITADLEAMHRAGIGGAAIFNIGGHGRREADRRVRVMSSEWRDLMRHAIREAGRLGIEINLNNSMAGWSSSGGPWITPELAMQIVTWSEVPVHGGTQFDAVLPQPPTRLDYYREIAVLAFPTPAAELTPRPLPVVTASSPGFDIRPLQAQHLSAIGRNWDSEDKDFPEAVALSAAEGHEPFVQFAYAEPFSARWLHIAFAQNGGGEGKLEASNDGAHWRTIQSFAHRNLAPVDLALAVPPARFWRVKFPAGKKLMLTGLQLNTGYLLTEWTGKAKFDSIGLNTPSFTAPDNVAPESCVICRDQIIDLTGKLDRAGHLSWDVPTGDWTILRIGYTPTGAKVGPAEEHAGQGLECDKCNPAALDVHFKNSLQPWFDDPELNPLIQYVHIDSYERGAQNWTARLPEEFKKRMGYEIRQYLPVLTGRVIGDVQESERFLWDFRNVVTSLMAENYFGHMHELCQKAGKRFTLEPYCQTQFNTVTCGGQADIPSTECWMGGMPSYHLKSGASPAHMYGRQLVQCESFTAPAKHGGNWSTDFWDMKELGDVMFTSGVNRMVFHVYVHQPWLDLAPGETLAEFGTHFERTNTWWGQMPAFSGYISRCQAVLQQGRFVADVLFSCGENSPSEVFCLVPVYPFGAMAIPGYDYDYCDSFVILNRLSVKDGRLVLPDGLSYGLLVLPEDKVMTEPMIRRIGELVSAGATVVAAKPTHSPSLVNQPSADQRVRELAEMIWGPCDGRHVTEHVYGKGRIFWGEPLQKILAKCAIAPDVQTPANRPLVRHIHRWQQDAEIYYLASSSLKAQTMDIAFRATGTPELLNPVDGTIRPLPRFHSESAKTVIPLRFEPRQSYFVLFRKQAKEVKEEVAASNFPTFRTATVLSGPWDVRFDPKWGGPEKVVFETLQDWTKRPENGIEYYSGKATYRKGFAAPPGSVNGNMFLDLGKIKNVAEVRLNDRALGIIWCAPWRVAIPHGLLKETGNRLEVDIVNLWPNRMIGDEQLAEDCEWGGKKGGWNLLKRWPDWLVKKTTPRTSGRYTFATFKHWYKDDALLESGLLGPVTIQVAE